MLRHYWGLSVEETAADLGVSPGTVKSQTSAALAAAALRPCSPTPPATEEDGDDRPGRPLPRGAGCTRWPTGSASRSSRPPTTYAAAAAGWSGCGWRWPARPPATLAVVLGITGLTAGDPTASDIEPATPPAEHVRADPGRTPSTSAERVGPAGPAAAAPPATRRSRPRRPATLTRAAPTRRADRRSRPRTPSSAATGDPTGAPPQRARPGLRTTSPPTQPPTRPATSSTRPADATAEHATPSPHAQRRRRPPPAPTDRPRRRAERPAGAPAHDGQGADPPGAGLLQRRASPSTSTRIARTCRPYDRTLDPQETTRLDSSGSSPSARPTAGRTTAPRPSVGVRVASGWDQVGWGCGDSDADWDCHPAVHRRRRGRRARRDPPGRGRARRRPGGRASPRRPRPRPTWSPRRATRRLVLPGDPPPVAARPWTPGTRSPPTAGPPWCTRVRRFTVTAVDRSARRARHLDGRRRPPAARCRGRCEPIYSGGGWTCLTRLPLVHRRADADRRRQPHGAPGRVARSRLGGGWLVAVRRPVLRRAGRPPRTGSSPRSAPTSSSPTTTGSRPGSSAAGQVLDREHRRRPSPSRAARPGRGRPTRRPRRRCCRRRRARRSRCRPRAATRPAASVTRPPLVPRSESTNRAAKYGGASSGDSALLGPWPPAKNVSYSSSPRWKSSSTPDSA